MLRTTAYFLGFIFFIGRLAIANSAAPPPETHRLQAQLQHKGDWWEASIDLPRGTNRFSIAFEALPGGGARPLAFSLLDDQRRPLKTGVETSASGEYSANIAAGSIHVSPRFSAPAAPAAPTKAIFQIRRTRDSGAPLKLLSIITDLQSPTLPQGIVDDGSREVCHTNESTKVLGRSIARLSIQSQRGSVSYCTGFAIGNNHLITNNHCVAELINQPSACESIKIEFNYTCSNQKIGIIQPTCEKITPPKSAILDYAVISYKALPNPIQPLIPAKISDSTAPPILLHHSAGMSMRLGITELPLSSISISKEKTKEISDARADCEGSIRAIDHQYMDVTPQDVRTVITHGVNTIGGASGSPVILDGKVVGLHFDRDRRYYPKGNACFSAGVEDCLTRKLALPNWAIKICDVLNDIPPSVKGVEKCS